ncbi:hypothetical protein GCM10010193_25790 [Kitasatospora atroaurantiaca]
MAASTRPPGQCDPPRDPEATSPSRSSPRPARRIIVNLVSCQALWRLDNDAAWRIDYQIASPGLAERAVKAYVERAATHEERWSDHAPVTVHYDH